MNSLITINQANLNGAPVQTVNARDLHAFLEIGKDFSTWIKDRIAQYEFLENQDYVIAQELSSPKSGSSMARTQRTTEYHLTLDMAKELSMVERNDKGKQARQYFIECERQLNTTLGNTLPLRTPSPVRATVEAAKAFAPLFRTARLLGCDKNAAAISANQAIMNLSGVNLLQQLGQSHLKAENQESLYYTPTELGQRLGDVSGKKVNLLLAGAGLQAKVGEHWDLLDAGREFARIFDTGKRHGSGAPIPQIKWSAAVLPLLKREEIA
ncbi:antA/AntB antirepressor family protein [Bordetella avium]|uniref:antA/AntB antirepressor family protein n=1 Tax=Bordetella avium TaxID=521 RepID=UPI0039FCD770